MDIQVIVFQDLAPYADEGRLRNLDFSLKLATASWPMSGLGFLLTLQGMIIVKITGQNVEVNPNAPSWDWDSLGCDVCPIANCSNRDAQDWIRQRLSD